MGIQTKAKYAGTLVDGEYVDRYLVQKKSDLHSVNVAAFMAFDIYFFRKKSIAHIPLGPDSDKATRLGMIRELLEYLKGPSTNAFVQFKRKIFHSPAEGTTIFDAVQRVLLTDKQVSGGQLQFCTQT